MAAGWLGELARGEREAAAAADAAAVAATAAAAAVAVAATADALPPWPPEAMAACGPWPDDRLALEDPRVVPTWTAVDLLRLLGSPRCRWALAWRGLMLPGESPRPLSCARLRAACSRWASVLDAAGCT